ncbi:hypothetical protein [Haladaptatus sp. NG-WS-4]
MPFTAKIAIGLLGYRYAYHLSLFGERLDAIGSKTPADEVEPTNWRVLLTQLSVLFLVLE